MERLTDYINEVDELAAAERVAALRQKQPQAPDPEGTACPRSCIHPEPLAAHRVTPDVEALTSSDVASRRRMRS